MASRRKRQRGKSGVAVQTRRLALLALATFFLIGILLPTGAFSLVDASRIGSIGVAGDSNADLGLSVFTCVEKNTADPLVTVSNDLEETVDVTVSLVDGGMGTLSVGGQSGDSVTFSLPVGNSDTVDMEATAGGPYPKSFDYTIDAAGADTSVSATRSSQIDNNCGSSTPSPTPTATPTPVPGNEPPVADFTRTRRGGSANVDVDGSPSSDPDGSIAGYEWYVDGTYETDGQTARLNAPSGSSITLVVTDNDGATNSTTKTAP